MRVPKRPFVFLQRYTKFIVVFKRPFAFLQLNKEFYGCTQTVIHFFYHKRRNLELFPNGHSLFNIDLNIQSYTQIPFIF